MCLLIIGFQPNTNRACRRQKPKWGDISTLPMRWMDTEKLKKDSWKSWVSLVPCSLHDFFSGSVTKSLDRLIPRATRERFLPAQAEILAMFQPLLQISCLTWGRQSPLTPHVCSSTKLGCESSHRAQYSARCVVELHVFMFVKRT